MDPLSGILFVGKHSIHFSNIFNACTAAHKAKTIQQILIQPTYTALLLVK